MRSMERWEEGVMKRQRKKKHHLSEMDDSGEHPANKKRKKGNNAIAGSPAGYGLSIAGQEIALTHEGDQVTGLSPMTADRAADDNSIASSIGSPSIGSVVETDEVIKGMMANDVKETGDGGGIG